MLKQNNMSMTMSVLRSWFFLGLVQLALGSVLLAAEQAPEPWAAKPLGPKIAPAPFVPALIKRELRATLKVHPAKGAEMMLVDAGRSACAIMPMGMWKRSKMPADPPQSGSPPTQKLRLRHERLELGMKAFGLNYVRHW